MFQSFDDPSLHWCNLRQFLVLHLRKGSHFPLAYASGPVRRNDKTRRAVPLPLPPSPSPPPPTPGPHPTARTYLPDGVGGRWGERWGRWGRRRHRVLRLVHTFLEFINCTEKKHSERSWNKPLSTLYTHKGKKNVTSLKVKFLVLRQS